MTTLTRRQRQVLNFIRRHIENVGYPPSGREIARKLNINGVRAVQKHIAALELKGALKKGTGARALEVTLNSYGRSLPIVGQVAAGMPITAEENLEGHLTLDSSLVRSEGCFLLRVKGDSMTGAAILNRDLVIVKPQPVADNGDIVVAMIEDEATVKRFKKENGEIELVPENPAYTPIKVTEHENSRIIGKVIGVVRI